MAAEPSPEGGPAHAYATVRAWIVEGRMRPGEHLVEQRIAEQLGLSRTPVREAVRMLAAEGLVVSERHRGAVVRTLDRDAVVDLYELRSRLEAYAAELAAQRRTEADIVELDGGIAEFAAALDAPDEDPLARTRRISAANRRVHDAVVRAGGHERLQHMLARAVDAPLVFDAFRHFDEAQLRRSHQFHTMIRNAIAAGEASRAAGLMREHILQGRDQVLLGLRTEGEG
ncbi:GntR family transcriptional regulator [Pseudonocardia kunmingensis]|uniref:GntR family transcriptional regulator n=1 Tax=Pseudonocardia kunmingensis TaxID=630975 RepID=UPI001479437A|nr:GntR family transcriptional regulator [Pseudonocardia kunmingensis]